MKKNLALLALLLSYSVQAEETFINHSKRKVQIQTEYSFCVVDAVEVPAANPSTTDIKGNKIDMNNANLVREKMKQHDFFIKENPGKSTASKSKSCCLKYMKIKTDAKLQHFGAGIRIDYYHPGTFLYDYPFSGCKDRTFNIYDDSTKPNGIRVEW